MIFPEARSTVERYETLGDTGRSALVIISENAIRRL